MSHDDEGKKAYINAFGYFLYHHKRIKEELLADLRRPDSPLPLWGLGFILFVGTMALYGAMIFGP